MTYFPLLNRRINNTEYYDIDETFLLLCLHVNFYYNEIINDPRIISFLNNSKTLLDKFTRTNSNMTTQQINSCFIAFNLMMYLSMNNMLLHMLI